LSLLLLGGVAADVSSQQPAAAPETKQSESGDKTTVTVPSTLPGAQSGDQKETTQPAPPAPGSSTVIDRQIETRTERVEREPAKFLGLDPTIAMVLGAVLVVVIVIGLVAMSRREEDTGHHHHA